MPAIDLDRDLRRRGEAEADPPAVHLGPNAPGRGANGHRLDRPPAQHFDVHRPAHIPGGERGEFGLIDGPLVAWPNLVEGHGRDAARVDRHLLAVHLDVEIVRERLSRRSRIDDHRGTRGLRSRRCVFCRLGVGRIGPFGAKQATNQHRDRRRCESKHGRLLRRIKGGGIAGAGKNENVNVIREFYYVRRDTAGQAVRGRSEYCGDRPKRCLMETQASAKVLDIRLGTGKMIGIATFPPISARQCQGASHALPRKSCLAFHFSA